MDISGTLPELYLSPFELKMCSSSCGICGGPEEAYIIYISGSAVQQSTVLLSISSYAPQCAICSWLAIPIVIATAGTQDVNAHSNHHQALLIFTSFLSKPLLLFPSKLHRHKKLLLPPFTNSILFSWSASCSSRALPWSASGSSRALPWSSSLPRVCHPPTGN